MNRRDTIFALAILGTLPTATMAQPAGKIWRVGVLSYRRASRSGEPDYFQAFPQGMRDLGYIEGRNLVIEWRYADGAAERLQPLADELARLNLDALISGNSAATSALQKATKSIPIVMATVNDPVGSGFVKSLAYPGGNITGLTMIGVEIHQKLLEMLRTIVPKFGRVAVLVNPINSSHAALLKNMEASAPKLGANVLPVEARNPAEIEIAINTATNEKTTAMVVLVDPLFIQQRGQIAELARKNRIPSISGFREYAEAGGLMSYGANFSDLFRRSARYVDKIFKGAKPSELPVEQATRFELILNGRTANALGLKVPNSLQVMADEIIS